MPERHIPKTAPVAPYQGGKRNLATRICALIDADNHHTYAEPFVGMGGIFLRFHLTTRAEFLRLIDTDPGTLTDLERAARFLYLQRTAFGGKVSGRNFGVSKDRPARFNLTTLEPMLEDLHSRLTGVVIECLDYGEFIPRYDRRQTLFYLDPPYWGCENDYGKQVFCRADFAHLAEVLGGIKGRFIMSLNDVEGVRETFGGFHISPIKTTYTIAAKSEARGERGEVLIANYDLSDKYDPSP